MKQMQLKNETGFTLIELTVVLLILIALAGLAMPYMGGTSSTALCNATDVTMQNVKKAIMERYYVDTLGFFPKNTKAGTDYNLKYLFIKPDDWNKFEPETQTGWRGPYLSSGMQIADISLLDSSFTNPIYTSPLANNDFIVSDGWGRPIVLQDTGNGFRLVSAGSGNGLKLSEASIDTAISANRAGDDRVLYLNTATPLGNNNPPCQD